MLVFLLQRYCSGAMDRMGRASMKQSQQCNISWGWEQPGYLPVAWAQECGGASRLWECCNSDVLLFSRQSGTAIFCALVQKPCIPHAGTSLWSLGHFLSHSVWALLALHSFLAGIQWTREEAVIWNSGSEGDTIVSQDLKETSNPDLFTCLISDLFSTTKMSITLQIMMTCISHNNKTTASGISRKRRGPRGKKGK